MSTTFPHVLVTGGAGFIGSHVCDALMDAGLRVRCMDNLATGSRTNVAHLLDRPGFELREADITDPRACHDAVQGVDAVLHLAALGSVPRSIADPLASEVANLGGFLFMLEACRHSGVRRFVYASSSSVYGDSAASPKCEGQEGRPLSPYAVTKAMDEAYAALYRHLFGLEPIGLRFFNVFGERQDPEGPYAAAIPRFIRALLAHRSPEVHGDGRQTRDFTYVGNAVRAMLAGLHCSDPRAYGDVFNVAYGESTDLLTLIDLLRERLAVDDPAIASMGPHHVAERPGDVRHSLADVSKAREVLGFTPTHDLAAGLDRAVPWYREHWG
jgi:UDP-N-acetylglucosamine 4-epimerase